MLTTLVILDTRFAMYEVIFAPTSIIVQDKQEHLDLIEGVVVDLLSAKWKSFIRGR